jgi:hypothetical protein
MIIIHLPNIKLILRFTEYLYYLLHLVSSTILHNLSCPTCRKLLDEPTTMNVSYQIEERDPIRCLSPVGWCVHPRKTHSRLSDKSTQHWENLSPSTDPRGNCADNSRQQISSHRRVCHSTPDHCLIFSILLQYRRAVRSLIRTN